MTSDKTREPACGFTSAECDYSKWYIIAAAVSAIIIVALLAFYCKKQGFKFFGNSNKTMAQISWMIPLEKVEMIKDERPADKSESDISSAWSYFHPPDGETAIVFNNIVKIRRFKQLKTINFDATEAKFLLSLKSLIHDNINPMIGMCFNNPTNELLVLSKFCPRGTLSDYLHNPEMRMDGRFKTAFLRDIINGLDYLHNAPIGFHGNLTTSNCVIDANFIVKLVSVGMDDILEDWKSNGWIAESGDEQPRRPLAIEILEEDLLYRAPEFLRKSAPPRPKLIRMGKSEQIRIKQQCRMGDIYSLGIIFFEVLFRQHPFTDFEGTVEDLINKLRFPSRQVVRPVVPKVLTKDHHPAMMQLMQSCWSEDAISRPGIKRVKKLFSTIYRVRGGLVDSIIQIMDQHANSLEKQVRERTRLLEEAQLRADRLLAQMIPKDLRADRLLAQMIPKDVARDLKLGRPVIPRNFEHSSVLFTDIVGFTTICGQSTPMEIVNFLNDLFTGYDAIISQSDAYKVETIGDAYMVVSGVPNENGTENVKIIATIALKMRQYLAGYKLPHISDRKMRARWGLHTGPVAAGVVGLIAPRYCLFGDTVNMASRMESTGEPEKIQTSSNFYESIQSRGDLFIMEKRGIIPVKGKGDCTTYWLIDYAATLDEN
uniref:Guanylate cyclase n=2 Tax=Panagrolaimus sp. JU765 TaxID=591449 RepID=A0AC34QMT1_9BILA